MSWMPSPTLGVKATLSLVVIEINDKVSPLRTMVAMDTRPMTLSVAMNKIPNKLEYKTVLYYKVILRYKTVFFGTSGGWTSILLYKTLFYIPINNAIRHCFI
jgi:hypothetical protein